MKKLTLLFLILIISACGDETEPAPDPNAAVNAAWALFEQGDYQGARDAFSAITNNEQATIGLGWSHLRLGNHATAIGLFNTVVHIDADAGETFSYWALNNYASCITSGGSAVIKDNTYVFSHDESVTFEDIYLHIAFSQYHLGSYSAAISHIQILDPTFTATENDPDIATVLLQKLEALSALYQ